MTLPTFNGIHHLKFPVSDLDRSTEFYGRAVGARRIGALDHIDGAGRLYAVILDVPGLGTFLELRLDPDLAVRHAGFDPITLAVDGRDDLAAWAAHFDAVDVKHSPVLNGSVGWLMAAEDPDGLRLRFYTRETHGPDIEPSQDPYWL